MPDITMCVNEFCKRKCYRRLAKPSIQQSYTDFETKPETCEYYKPMKRKQPTEH